MQKFCIKSNGGFTLVELLIVIVIIGILAAVAVPAYTKHVTNAKAAEAFQMLSACVPYLHGYKQIHGEWPAQSESTGDARTDDWLEEIAGKNNQYFYYRYERGTITTRAYLKAYGNAPPFSDSDYIILESNDNGIIWHANGKMVDIKPN